MLNLLKLASLNLEGHKHIDLQVPFLKSQAPDVVCLQEVFESDFIFLKTELGMNGSFAPMCAKQFPSGSAGEGFAPLGVAILARMPIKVEAHYYVADARILHEFIGGVTSQDQMSKALLCGTIAGPGNERFVIGTTHFTWTPDGQADDRQRRDLQALLKKLATIPEIVLCGDFNAPRGGEIFGLISQKYKDNIPAHYVTSLDRNLHRAGHLDRMVDGLFSTPEYKVAHVQLESGVSDHCAIVAEISRAVEGPEA